jgi:hypothetical protein
MSELLVGQLVVATIVITNPAAANAPVDDPTDALTVYRPDQTTLTPTVNHVGAAGSGTYTAQVTFDQPGWWEFVSSATTTGAGKGRAKVYVSPVP